MISELERSSVAADTLMSGELIAAEDVVIAGRVDGQITLRDHHLTIERAAFVRARVVARAVTIHGVVEGSIRAGERVDVLPGASVRGHVTAPTVVLVDGAQFNGTIDPDKSEPAMLVARYRERHRGAQ